MSTDSSDFDELKSQLNVYLNELSTLQQELDLNQLLDDMENYSEQMNASKSSSCMLFRSVDSPSPPPTRHANKSVCTLIDKREIRQKVLFKLNQLMSDKIELLHVILYVLSHFFCCCCLTNLWFWKNIRDRVEARLRTMTRVQEFVSERRCSVPAALVSSIQQINKTFWLKYIKSHMNPWIFECLIFFVLEKFLSNKISPEWTPQQHSWCECVKETNTTLVGGECFSFARLIWDRYV